MNYKILVRKLNYYCNNILSSPCYAPCINVLSLPPFLVTVYQNVTNSNPDENLNLDNLLIQLRAEVTPKWHEFGVVIGVPRHLLDQYSSYPADERLIEVLNYWLNNHQNPMWRDMAKVLHEIELNELAEGVMNVYETGTKLYPIIINARL